MKMPPPSPTATERLELLFGGDPRIRLRKMFGQPAAFVNGNLCAGIFGRDLFMRLDGADVQVLSKVAGVRPFEPMPGRRMTHYLVLPPKLLGQPALAKKWAARSIQYVLSLPAK